MRISDWSSDVCSSDLLLPVMTSATTAASDFITELQTGEGTGGKVAAAFKTVGDNLDTIAPVLGVVTAGLVTYATASKAVAIATAIQAAGTAGATGATWALNAALRATPTGIVEIGRAAGRGRGWKEG